MMTRSLVSNIFVIFTDQHLGKMRFHFDSIVHMFSVVGLLVVGLVSPPLSVKLKPPRYSGSLYKFPICWGIKQAANMW